MNPFTSRRRATPAQVAAIDAFTDSTRRIRDTDHTPTARAVLCPCGRRRTQSVTGLCGDCRKETT